MFTTVSVRGQTVIPQKIREELNIVPSTRLKWILQDGMIIVFPIPADPVRAAVGILKGRGLSTDDLLAERRSQREREP